MTMILNATTGPYRQERRYGDTKRPIHDFYPTPPEATRALLSVEQFDGTIWECACGDGAIATVLKQAGHDVVSTDLIYRGYGTGDTDFLKQRTPLARNIVTNPPYGKGLADDFVKHALTLTGQSGGSVAMLMNLASLCHPSRHDWYVANSPAAIYGIDDLVCWPHGDPRQAGRTTALHRYCWMVWKPEHSGRPTFWWLSTKPFRTGTHEFLSTTFN